jgi:hypothetical protein
MNGKPYTGEVCGARGKAVETAALWKPWKNQKAVFQPFPHRLENSPQKARVEFSTVPTASAASFFSNKETREKRRIPATYNRNWVACESYGVTRELGWSTRNLNRGRLGESFFLTSPFIEPGGRRSLKSLLDLWRFQQSWWARKGRLRGGAPFGDDFQAY